MSCPDTASWTRKKLLHGSPGGLGEKLSASRDAALQTSHMQAVGSQGSEIFDVFQGDAGSPTPQL